MIHFSFVLHISNVPILVWDEFIVHLIFCSFGLREAEYLVETRLAVVLSGKTDGDAYLTDISY